MSPSKNESYSLHFFRVWVAIGVLGMLFMAAIPFFLIRVTNQEWARFQGCKLKQRMDCNVSLTWVTNQWTLDQGTDPAVAQQEVDAKASETTRIEKESDDAPNFMAVRPQNMQLTDHRYLAKDGTQVNLQVEVDGAEKVELSLIWRGEDGSPFPKYIAAMKQDKPGTWSGTFTVEKGLFGEIMIVATNKAGKKATMYVNVAADQQPVAN